MVKATRSSQWGEEIFGFSPAGIKDQVAAESNVVIHLWNADIRLELERARGGHQVVLQKKILNDT
jgi:hypothetical protein